MEIITRNQNPFRKKWTNSSPGVGYTRGQVDDEDFHNTLALHDPLWKYIIHHYNKEVYTHINIAPVIVLGYQTLPVAIELSQWGYDVIFITDKIEEQKKAKIDCKIQAGFLKENIWFNFRKNSPKAACMCFIGILDAVKTTTEVHTLIDLYLRRVREIICAIKDDRDWIELLRGKYNFKTWKYPNAPYRLLSIKVSEESTL